MPKPARRSRALPRGGTDNGRWLQLRKREGTLLRYPPMPTVLPKEKPDFAKLVHEVPHKPGVYLMRDRFNRVIYVGKARDLRKRVGSYFLPSKLAQADLKTRAMLEAVWDFETPHCAERTGVAPARREADQGIPAALQRFLPRR